MAGLSELSLLTEQITEAALRAVSGGIPDPNIDREMTSAYSDTEDVLAPGERKVQVRPIPELQDLQSDSNATVLGCTFEFTVVRSLHLEEHAEDEELYRTEEMLFGIGRLLEVDRWKALSRVTSVTLDTPALTTEPERVGNLVTYTVSLSVEYSAF